MSLNILINVGEITLYVTKLTSIILVRNVAFYTILLINVRENRRGEGWRVQEWTVQRHRQYWAEDTERKQAKQKHNIEYKTKNNNTNPTNKKPGRIQVFLAKGE